MRLHSGMETMRSSHLFLAGLCALLLLACPSRRAQKARTQARYLVYIGTYTTTRSKGIYAYRFDADSGRLTSLGLVAETVNPSFLAVDPSRRFLYAVNEISNYAGGKGGGVSAFAIDRATGKLTFLNEVSSRGREPCHVSLDKTGKFVMVANYGGGSVAVFPVLADGRLGEASAFVEHHGSSVNPERQEGPHAHSIGPSPDNRFVLAADLGLDRLLVYRFDSAQGSLEPNDPPFATVKPGAAAPFCLSSRRPLCVHDQRNGFEHHRLFLRRGARKPARARDGLDAAQGFRGRERHGRDRSASEWQVSLRLEPRARQHRCVCNRRREG